MELISLFPQILTIIFCCLLFSCNSSEKKQRLDKAEKHVRFLMNRADSIVKVSESISIKLIEKENQKNQVKFAYKVTNNSPEGIERIKGYIRIYNKFDEIIGNVHIFFEDHIPKGESLEFVLISPITNIRIPPE